MSRQLRDAAQLLANVVDRLGADDEEQTVMCNDPDPTERPLARVTVHTVHEARHHLLDVQRQLEDSDA